MANCGLGRDSRRVCHRSSLVSVYPTIDAESYKGEMTSWLTGSGLSALDVSVIHQAWRDRRVNSSKRSPVQTNDVDLEHSFPKVQGIRMTANVPPYYDRLIAQWLQFETDARESAITWARFRSRGGWSNGVGTIVPFTGASFFMNVS
jgi:hypothetical protein